MTRHGWVLVAGAAAMLLGVACGDDTENTSGSQSTASSSSASSSSSGTGGAGGAGGGMGGAGGGMGGAGGGMGGAGGGMGGAGGGGNLLNGCDKMTATDMTNSAAVTIKFGGAQIGEKYEPPCIRVKKGTDVTFQGNFMFHPLQGGKVTNMIGAPDPASPIKSTATGNSATFKLDAAGDYPYYCTAHFATGMAGAVFVE